MGASVLHEDAIFPVFKANIPINIKNTNKPDDEGTFIVPKVDNGDHGIITGIAGRKGFSVLAIEKTKMNAEIGFGRKVLMALEKKQYELRAYAVRRRYAQRRARQQRDSRQNSPSC